MAEARTPANPMSEANSESPVTGDSGIWWQESSPHSPPVEQENLEVLQKPAIKGPSNNHSQGTKPTASKNQKQYICEVDQIDELWRDRDHIHQTVHDLGKLGIDYRAGTSTRWMPFKNPNTSLEAVPTGSREH
ncbi:hypothetical protein FocnCong_v001911 [Fusarium oxysporum f. sp. conglutinans]|nr:hypothetical protein FocnCong_v001911 [Fusarium oxysporum f. sp. conglutinans]